MFSAPLKVGNDVLPKRMHKVGTPISYFPATGRHNSHAVWRLNFSVRGQLEQNGFQSFAMYLDHFICEI